MRLILPLIQLTVFLAMTPLATANVVGLPEELDGAAESQIEYDAIDEMAEIYFCELSAKDIRALQTKAEFVIKDFKLQEPEYASYPGELEAFTLRVAVELPMDQCHEGGVHVCKFRYDLYDENAYDIDSSLTTCTPAQSNW